MSLVRHTAGCRQLPFISYHTHTHTHTYNSVSDTNVFHNNSEVSASNRRDNKKLSFPSLVTLHEINIRVYNI